jgi:3-oxoacyl-[acyl-carrier-protein] synthase III
LSTDDLLSHFFVLKEICELAGMPLDIVERKLGILKKPIPGKDDHTCAMGIKAAKNTVIRWGN